MKFLFIHQNFPAQFLHLAAELVKKNHEVSTLTLNNQKLPEVWRGIKVIEYSITRGNGKDTFPLTIDFETKTIRAAACYSKATELKSGGYVPDVIISHPGWGESLFLKQVWPESLLKIYCEFFYSTSGADVGFDSEIEPNNELYLPRVQLKNINMLLHADQVHSCISPTKWQASTFPEDLKAKISVVHDGIDTDAVKPNNAATIEYATGGKVSRSDEVITFVSRSLEPYRGFHIFMRSLPKILKRRKNAVVLIVGDETTGYGSDPTGDDSWKTLFLKEVRPLLNNQQYERIHFLGRIPYERFKQFLCVSTVHVYLTYPFVLSWSLLEAMSSNCSIVASKTPPVEEVITNGETGILVDFFEYEKIAEEVLSLFENPDKRAMLGANARSFIRERYDLKTKCLPDQIAWAERI